MPIIPQFPAPTPKADGPAEKPAPVMVCTIEATDSGDTCRWCGYASGSRHAKER